MRIVYLFALVMAAYDIYAEEVIWKSGNTFVVLFKDKKNFLYSTGCKDQHCLALQLTKKLSFNDLKANSLSGGKNPGAVLCSSVLNEQVVYLRDLQGNENSFCFFKDKSLISNSNLAEIAFENDRKQRANK